MKKEITFCPKTGVPQRTFTIDLTQDEEKVDEEIDEMVNFILGLEENN